MARNKEKELIVVHSISMQQLSNEMAAEYNIEFDQALAQFMLSSPTILPAAGVYFALLGVTSRSP